MRRHELALLDIDDAAGASGLHQQIGLAAEERGDLENVGGFGRGRGLRGLVNVGQNRNIRLAHAISECAGLLSIPGRDRNRRCDRLALSKEALKTNRPTISPISRARKWTCSSLSITHGPAIKQSSGAVCQCGPD